MGRPGRRVAIACSLLAAVLATPARSAAGATPGCPYSGVALTFAPSPTNGYPSMTGHGVIVDEPLLDAFAAEYACGPRTTSRGEIATGPPDPNEFFLFWLPNRVNDIVNGHARPPAGAQLDMSTPSGLGRALWLAHLSGWYQGVSLRHNQRMSGSGTVSDNTVSNAYKVGTDRPRAILERGDDAQVLAYNRAAVRDHPAVPPLFPPDTVGALSLALPPDNDLGFFTLESGFLFYILPPSGNAPKAKPFKEPFFTYDSSKLLSATYALPEIASLRNARADYAAIPARGAQAAARRDEMERGAPGEENLIAEQQRYFAYTTALYSFGTPNGTRYADFPPDQYDRLLAWTAYATMTTQANALNAFTAYASGDAERGRRHVRASALWSTEIFMYVAAVSDSRSDALPLVDKMPKFTSAASAEACTSRRSITIRLPAGARSGVVRVAGRRVATRRRGSRLTARIDLRGRARQVVTVRVTGRTKTGKPFRQVRRYRPCTPRNG